MLYIPSHHYYRPQGYIPPTGTLTNNVADSMFTHGTNFTSWTLVGSATAAAGGITMPIADTNGAAIAITGLVSGQMYRGRMRFTTRVGATTLRIYGWGQSTNGSPTSNFGADNSTGPALTIAIPGVTGTGSTNTNPSGSTFPTYCEVYFRLYSNITGTGNLVWNISAGSSSVVMSDCSIFPIFTPQYSVAVKGDSYGAFNATRSQNIENAIVAVNPTGVVSTGDNGDTGGISPSTALGIIKATDAQHIPWKLTSTAGNHDFSYGIDSWATYLGITQVNGTGTATNWRRWPNANGPIHFFNYNNVPSGDGGGTEGAGYNTNTYSAALITEITNSNAAWKIVNCHRPARSSGSGELLMKSADYANTPTNSIQWNWSTRGICMLISGHIHGQERYTADSINYITCGLGGGDHHAMTAAGEANSVFRSNATEGPDYWSGYGLISFTNSELIWEYYCVNRAGAGITINDPNTHLLVDRVKMAYV